MLAVVIERDQADRPRVRLVRDHPPPQPGPGDVLIDVRVAGICSTDLELARGYMGFCGVPGHEFVGTVRTPGPLQGRRVVAEINVPPPGFEGDLPARKHAAGRSVLGILGRDGAFAKQIALPASCCLPVPDALADDVAVFAEPVAAALQILDDCDLSGVARAGVIGAGRLGLLCAQVLTRACPQTDLLVRSAARDGIARALGLRPVALTDVGDARPYDLLVDCTGSPDGLRWSMAHVRPRGQIVLKSTYADPQPLDLAPLVIDEIRVHGSRCGPMDGALAVLARGDVLVGPLVSKRYPLARGEEAFEAAGRRENIKVLLDCGGG